MKPLVLRFGGFFSLPLLGTLAPFLVLPIVSRLSGTAGWASIGAGQAIGSIGATIVLYGWWIAGPARLARTLTGDERKALYVRSLQGRLAVALAVVPVAAAITLSVSAPEWRSESVILAASGSLAGLSPAWYCVGSGRALDLAIFDIGPRIVASVLAAAVLLATGQVWTYAVLTGLAPLVGALLFTFIRIRPSRRHFASLGEVRQDLRDQLPIIASGIIGTAYTSTPVPISTALSPAAQASALVSVDKLYKIGLITVTSLANALQSWVLEDGGRSRRRHTIAIRSHAVLGIAGAAGITLLGPTVTGVLFGAALAADHITCLWYGIAFAFISVSTPLARNILVPGGRTTGPLIASAVGAVVGLPTMWLLHSVWQSTGVAAGLAISEIFVFAALLVQSLNELGRWRQSQQPHILPSRQEKK